MTLTAESVDSVVDVTGMVGLRLRKAVRTLPTPARTVAEYHFGWLDRAGHPTGKASLGKLLRARLALVACIGAGANPEVGLPAAVAVELIHNFSLLHDDVMDSDALRRHRPTAWSVFGVSAAVLAGDCLWALACRTLADADSPHAAQASRSLAHAVGQLAVGQSLDLDFEHRNEVSVDQYLEMVRGKTGSLLGCACHTGALLAGVPPARAEHLRRFGVHLGIAFQAVDDLLGIWGDPAVTGKPSDSDLAARKKTLPVLTALQNDDGALARFYQSPPTSHGAPRGQETAVMAALIAERGGRRLTMDLAREHHRLALAHLRHATLTTACEQHLTDLAGQCIRRQQ